MSEHIAKRNFNSQEEAVGKELVPAENPHLCAAGCGCNMVYMEKHEPVVPYVNCYLVALCCPNCREQWYRHWDGPTLQRFKVAESDGVESLENYSAQLTTDNMQELADTFSHAINNDLIGPEDFATPRGVPYF